MYTRTLSTLTSAILFILIPEAALATDKFPVARYSPASCSEMMWPADLADGYPKLIAACQEVVLADDGSSWARFNSKFENTNRDGRLIFAIQDSNQHYVEDVYLTPSDGQMAYINGRETSFNLLRRGQVLNLYLPEGQSGFSAKVGVPLASLATIEPKKVEVESQMLSMNMPSFEHVHFTLGSVELNSEALQILDKQALLLKDHPNMSVNIAGHTSASATRLFNQNLSERRAEAVRDYLITTGHIERSRLTTMGFGETRPFTYEAKPTELNSSQALANMRVELKASSN